MGLPAAFLAQLGVKGVGEYNKAALGTSKLEPNSAINHAEALGAAAIARAADIAPDAPALKMALDFAKPNKKDPGGMANHRHSLNPSGDSVSHITINPNADASYLAHEMGHAVAQKTKAGRAINQARHAMNRVPKLGKSHSCPCFPVPAVASALQAGDDDTAETLALAAAINSPTLIDEALATKNALAIMDNAGMRHFLSTRTTSRWLSVLCSTNASTRRTR